MALNSETMRSYKQNSGVENTQKAKLDMRQTAQYVADMVLELRNMAKAVELKTLQGLLEVTFYEAFSSANRVEIPPEEIEHLRELARVVGG